MKLEENMKLIADEMNTRYKRISKQIKQSGLKGTIAEESLREFLKVYFPKGLGIATGEIVSIDGKVSKQQDVIVYDRIRCPILIKQKDIHVLPVEGVYAVIEVKSVLNTDEILKSVKNIKSVKIMQKKAYKYPISKLRTFITELGEKKEYFNTMGIVFAFESPLTLDKIKENIENEYKKEKIAPKEQIDLVFILNKGLLIQFDKKKGVIYPTKDFFTDFCKVKSKFELLLFYLILMERLGSVFCHPISVKDYAKFDYEIE